MGRLTLTDALIAVAVKQEYTKTIFKASTFSQEPKLGQQIAKYTNKELNNRHPPTLLQI